DNWQFFNRGVIFLFFPAFHTGLFILKSYGLCALIFTTKDTKLVNSFFEVLLLFKISNLRGCPKGRIFITAGRDLRRKDRTTTSACKGRTCIAKGLPLQAVVRAGCALPQVALSLICGYENYVFQTK
ncbi:MAG: hypothetical protein LBT27_04350, partial [Prevotellaceae bacterium]|nr:hypothetical protein [Prevotellaceae bacterium]